MLARAFPGDLVTGVGVAHDATGRIIPQDTLDPCRRGCGTVAADYEAGVLRVTHADAAAVME